MFAVALEGLRKIHRVGDWYPEFLSQCWFIAKVTSLPVILISIPFGMVIALHVGSFNRQLGAEASDRFSAGSGTPPTWRPTADGSGSA